MNWERPLRWLVASVGKLEHVKLLGLQNPIQVKCDAGVGTHTRTKPYVVASGEFDICHPAFAHLRLPERASSTRNCTGWSLEGKTFDVLLLGSHQLQQRVHALEGNLTQLLDRLHALETALDTRLPASPPQATPHPASLPLAPEPGPTTQEL